MNYKDYTESTSGEKYINGHYVGVKHGTPTSDALNEDHTGYEVYKESIRQGTITQDALEKINVLTLVSISITTPATKLQYKVGEELDLTGLVVTGTYGGGIKKVINITKDNVTGFNSAMATESQALTITVDGIKTSYNIKIVQGD